MPVPVATTPDDTRLADLQASILSVPVGPDLAAYGNEKVDVVLVEALDADGRVGTGFTYTFGPGCRAVQTMVDEVMAPDLVNRRLSGWPAAHARWTASTRRLGRGVFAPALSAVDIALWDLRAQVAGLPLCTLLGAPARPVAIYGSGRSGNRLGVGELVERTESYVAEGYRAVKLRVGARPPEEDLARVAAVRAAVGDTVRLMVDANERLDLPAARWLAVRLEELGVFWLEEPVPAEQLGAYRMIAQASGIAVAAGEHLVGHQEFVTYATEGAASVLQPDSALGGGITETLRVCEFASGYGLPVAPHSLPELHVHVAVAQASVSYVEHFPLLDHLIAEPIAQRDGMAEPPDRAGHGIAWDRAAIAACTVAPASRRG